MTKMDSLSSRSCRGVTSVDNTMLITILIHTDSDAYPYYMYLRLGAVLLPLVTRGTNQLRAGTVIYRRLHHASASRLGSDRVVAIDPMLDDGQVDLRDVEVDHEAARVNDGGHERSRGERRVAIQARSHKRQEGAEQVGP